MKIIVKNDDVDAEINIKDDADIYTLIDSFTAAMHFMSFSARSIADGYEYGFNCFAAKC